MATGFPILFEPKLWTPAQVSSAVWLDANDASTVTLNGVGVSQWSDKSGNNRNVLQGTAANQPKYYRAQNYFTYSEQFNNAIWAKTSLTAVADQTAAPDGSTTADKIYPTITASATYGRQVYSTTVGSVPYVCSCYFKAENKTYGWIQCTIGSDGTFAAIDLANGNFQVNLLSGAGLISPAAVVTNAGNGWYRLELRFTAPSSLTSIQCYIGPGDSLSSRAVTASGTNGIYVWGMQLKQAFEAGVYQRTDDIYSITTTPCVDWGINSNSYTLSFTTGANTDNWQECFAAGCFDAAGATFATYTGLIGSAASAGTGGGLGMVGTQSSANWTGGGMWGSTFYHNGSTTATATAIPTIQTPFVIRGNAASAVGVNGLALGSDRLLGGRGWRGRIFEAIIFSSALTLAERQVVEGYLAWKWNTVSALASDHPYKNNPPTA